jgi:hypothetical protein
MGLSDWYFLALFVAVMALHWRIDSIQRRLLDLKGKWTQMPGPFRRCTSPSICFAGVSVLTSGQARCPIGCIRNYSSSVTIAAWIRTIANHKSHGRGC